MRRETKAWQVGLAVGVRAFRQAGEGDSGPQFVDDEEDIADDEIGVDDDPRTDADAT